MNPHAVPTPPGMPFAQSKALFRYGEQTIWSTQFFPGATAIANGTSRLFSTQLGQVGQGWTLPLSIGETSIKEPGRVPQGIAYDVFGIAVQPLHSIQAADGLLTFNQAADTDATIGDLLNLLYTGVISWDFTQTQVQICPAMLAGAGGGAFGAISTTQNATDRGHMNNGAGGVFLYQQYPVALPGATTFAILLQFGSRAPLISATNGLAVRVVLLGYYKNVIEVG